MEFLQLKFHEHCDPSYSVKEIKPETIQDRREKVKLDVYDSIDSSSLFQVMVFTPHEDLRAAQRICLCDDCKKSYGSCSLFTTYSVNVGKLKGNTLRSAMAMEISDDNAEMRTMTMLIVIQLCMNFFSQDQFVPLSLVINPLTVWCVVLRNNF